MTISCTRRLTFCAGHRVYGHESKCSNMHGHNYVVYITAEMPAIKGTDTLSEPGKALFTEAKLDGLGRVVDFSVLKNVFGAWIDQYWDHGFILYEKDPLRFSEIFGKLFILPYNPTAENLARYLLEQVAQKIPIYYGIIITKVVIEETENCTAEVTS